MIRSRVIFFVLGTRVFFLDVLDFIWVRFHTEGTKTPTGVGVAASLNLPQTPSNINIELELGNLTPYAT